MIRIAIPLFLMLAGCGTVNANNRPPVDPPAKEETALLRQQELAAEKRAAEADAAGDTEISDYNRRLSKNRPSCVRSGLGVPT